MNKVLQLNLVQKFPSLYRDYGGDPTVTCMAWGLAVGDGWYQLIYNLSVDLVTLVAKEPSGFKEKFAAAQVKEKFGGLCFYTTYTSEAIERRISQAEELSFTICEECGDVGEIRSGGWMRTLCTTCHDMSKRGVK